MKGQCDFLRGNVCYTPFFVFPPCYTTLREQELLQWGERRGWREGEKERWGEKMSGRYGNQEEHLLHFLKPESFCYQASFFKIQMFPESSAFQSTVWIHLGF